MSVWRNTWWWLAVIAFALHQVAERAVGLNLGAFDSYLDPFCAPPILLGFWLFERQQVFRAPRLSWLETAIATLILAVIFEEVFPKYEEGFRRDIIDYGFYALGGLYFYFLINRGQVADNRSHGSDSRLPEA